MPTYGAEEEVFIAEPDKPALSSLYYLARLLWNDPRRNYFCTASNFARGSDLRQGIMSGVEVATSVHSDVDSLLEELLQRRQELARVSDGLIVPLGTLINQAAPTNSCAFQVHIGVKDRRRVYDNLVHFMPLLSALMLNSPYAGCRYFGKSYRMAKSYAIGPLTGEVTQRFQDIIVAKRLGTIEVRVFDPTWDVERIRVLLKAIDAIASLDCSLPANTELYNKHRETIARDGFLPEFEPLYTELGQMVAIPRKMLDTTAADKVKTLFETHGLLGAYSALDNGYRCGILEPREIPPVRAKALKSALGFTGYYIPKLPYIIWKYLKES